MNAVAKKALSGCFIILAVGLLMFFGVYLKYEKDMDLARISYVSEQRYESQEVVKRFEYVFNTVYEGLRIIASLPGVKNIDRHAHHFAPDARQSVREIYNTIGKTILLSEIYIVPADFNPDAIDPATGRREEPILSFDELISGKTALGAGQNFDGKLKLEGAAEVEEFEYRFFVEQVEWFKKYFPKEDNVKKFEVPAMTSPELITCDNTRFNPLEPDNKDRAGLVYSIPFYDLRGRYKGIISGVILSSVLSDYLPPGNYILGNRKNGYTLEKKNGRRSLASKKWIEDVAPDPQLIYSEVLPVKVYDTGGEWYMWAGSPNAVFSQRRDVGMAFQFALLGYLGSLFLVIVAIAAFLSVLKHNNKLEGINNELREHHLMLEKSRAFIKKFSGKMLSAREEEKKRLGRDLHDTVGSMAVYLNAKLAVIENQVKGQNQINALNNIRQMKESLDSIVKDFKEIAVNLRPPQLETVGLSGALKEYCGSIVEHTNVNIEFTPNVDDDKISGDIAIALFRIVQEALNNVLKHAHAQKVVIDLYEEKEKVFLEIHDDGMGFHAEEVEGDSPKYKMGIIGMRERVESYGGGFSVQSSLGQGTTVKVMIPLKNELA